MSVTSEQRTFHAMDEVIEDFEFTREYHRGNLGIAAWRLQMSEDALEQALYRARRKGYAVGPFHRSNDV